MEWQQLIYFKTLGHYKHYSRAAEAASISQPALSRSIANLEKELGVPLFERKGRMIKLTVYGEYFLARVEKALNQIELGKQEILELTDPESGQLTISFIDSSHVVSLISSFYKEHPLMKLKLNQASSNQIIHQLRTGEIDIGFVSYTHDLDPEEISIVPIEVEELFIVVSKIHALSVFDQIDLRHTKDESFALYNSRFGGLRTLTESYCKSAGFSPNVIFEGEQLASILDVVSSGMGITLVPDNHLINKSLFKLISIKEPSCFKTISLIWRNESFLPPSAVRFIDYVINEGNTSNNNAAFAGRLDE